LPDLAGEPFTVTAWVRTDGDGTIFSRCAPEGRWSRGGKSLFIDDGVLVYDIGWVGEIRGKVRIADNRWHHVAFTGARPQRAYIDGKLDMQGSMSPLPDVDGHVFKVGYTAPDFGGAYGGLVDDVCVYSRVLSAEEIASLAGGKQPALPGLVARWAFDDGSSDSVGQHAVHLAGKTAYEAGRTGKALKLTRAASGRRRASSRKRSTTPPPSPVEYSEFAVKDHPSITFDKLLFVKRQTYHSSHFYTDFIDGCSRYGGNLCVLDLNSGAATDLIPSMKDGIFGRFDLHFSARKVIFDWKKAPREGFRIYEIDIDAERGTAVGEPRQITFPPADEEARIAKYDNSHLGRTARMYYHQTDDMHPCYLPDGGIVFVSTRCEYGTLCDAPDVLTTAIMHRMDGDGSNMRPLSNSAVSEFSPSMLEDGRILYTRWEYVDKGQLGVKCLWSMRPDGSQSSEVYGNDIRFPPTFLHGRQVPGEPNLFVLLGTPHFPQSGIGTVILADTTKNIRTREPMTYVTPHTDIRQEPGWNQLRDGKWVRDQFGPLYMDPYPLNKTEFLVAHNPDRRWDDPVAYGLYILTVSGKHALIHREDGTSCWQPFPLRPRKTPPVLPPTTNPELAAKDLAVCVVQDIYFGMEGIERGEVKYIRVMEQVPRPWDCRRFWKGDGNHTSLVGGGALAVKAMWGIVPVEKDGSAHFYVPANRNIYFQALDEYYMELQRERTYVNYMPGEKRSCVGCHELPNDTPPPMESVPIAATKAPMMPGPQPGDSTGRQAIHFPSYIQPILDRHCVTCHKGKGSKGKFDLRGEPKGLYSLSWYNLIHRKAAPTYREASDWDGTEYAGPKSIGSHKSRLIKALREGRQHADLKLSQAEFVRLATWVDASGVFYGSYWGRRDARHRDHPNFRPVPSFEEAISTVCPTPMEER